MKSSSQVIRSVRERISKQGLSLIEAARSIGVTVNTLERHLGGAYVRSDSVAKYRIWLGNRARLGETRALFPQQKTISGKRDQRETLSWGKSPTLEESRLSEERVFEGNPPKARHLVVDLFSGIGGMSLGFDLFREGTTYRTVLALDNDPAMVRAFNCNVPVESKAPVCREADLTDFLNQTEVLAYYLDHLRRQIPDAELDQVLGKVKPLAIEEFKAIIRRLDKQFLADLGEVRESKEFRSEFRKLAGVMGQTSILGFHSSLKLPRTSTGAPVLPLMQWIDDGEAASPAELARAFACDDLKELQNQEEDGFRKDWANAVRILESRTGKNGQGQLRSSAERIRSFLGFLESAPAEAIRETWIGWRASRRAIRLLLFVNEGNKGLLEAAYLEPRRRVSVVLGGPPCQGFSRIGRGKIRSLRESGVQVHEHGEAGDSRNLLLYNYVLFVSALRPDVFLFENVSHFKAEVKTPDGVFRATEVLAEAVHALTDESLHYQVHSRVVGSANHLVPQTRDRYFMVGVLEKPSLPPEAAKWLLLPRFHPPVPLRAALMGLADPQGLESGRGKLKQESRVADVSTSDGHEAAFWQWIRMARPGQTKAPAQVDAHVARETRADDAAFFSLLAPGARWMDYRCDASKTLAELRDLIQGLRELLSDDDAPADTVVSRTLGEVGTSSLDDLYDRLDGSLALRLLLEAVQPLEGEVEHHLLAPGYMAKREGKHGDWLARMHPGRPSKTIVSHMAKDTYAYVHPSESRMLSVRETARIQTFPDWFQFGMLSLVDAFRGIGNAVPPLLSSQLAERTAQILWASSGEHQVRAVDEAAVSS